LYPSRPADIPYDVELYRQLERAKHKIPKFDRDLEVSASKLDKLPLLGQLWQGMRQQLHRISLFYVNRASKHQAEVNWHLVEAVGRLTAVTQQQQRQINDLQQQVDQLQKTQTNGV
jgi:hypothetical protein